MDAIAWSDNNTEAIAGLHNKGKRAFAIFDGASAIPDGGVGDIEGALTDGGTELFWTVFGNRTRSAGRFRECSARRPLRPSLPSAARTIRARREYQQDADATWVKDTARIPISCACASGVFPRAGAMQFIDSERIAEAATRALEPDPTAPLVMGVDIARQGADQTVIRFRRGLDARSMPAVKFRIPDLMHWRPRHGAIDRHSPDAVSVDGTGIGWASSTGSPARLPTCVGIDFGARADRTDGGDAAGATPTSGPRCGAS